ncbi:hypothetical protein CGRA01v4_03443 [Colletotrichum graminicola]|nr:hypothetical protein CGRA01v4_03443 [Colletotrichum graminicola]
MSRKRTCLIAGESLRASLYLVFPRGERIVESPSLPPHPRFQTARIPSRLRANCESRRTAVTSLSCRSRSLIGRRSRSRDASDPDRGGIPAERQAGSSGLGGSGYQADTFSVKTGAALESSKYLLKSLA